MQDRHSEMINKLVKALIKCPCFDTSAKRDDIVNQLPDHIRDRTPRRDSLRDDVKNIVNTCLRYEGGLDYLIHRVRRDEGESLPMREVDKIYKTYSTKLAIDKENNAQSEELKNEINLRQLSMNPALKLKIFISYRHVNPDEDLAKFLVDFLEQRGHRVFIDNQMLIGIDWVKDIESHIKAAEAFLVLLSKDSIRSDMVRQEVKLAHEMIRQKPGYKILPVRIDYNGALPYDLASYLDRYQYALWQPATEYETIVQQITLSLESGENLPFQQHTSVAGIKQLRKLLENEKAPLSQTDLMLAKEIEMETGAMKPASPYYIERASDAELFQQLKSKRQPTLLVSGARQMGKSSLLARVIAQAKEKKNRVFYLDFQTIDKEKMQTLSVLNKYIAIRMQRELRPALKVDDVWDDDPHGLGAKDNLFYYIEDALLANDEKPLLLLFDEADMVFNYDYRNDFFGMMRSWHNSTATDENWDNISLVIAHSTEPTLWIENIIEQSPFNVGYKINMVYFTADEVMQLNERYHYPLKTDKEFDSLMKLVGGQPYLVRQSLYSMVKHNCNMPELETMAAQEIGPFGDHLRQFLWRFEEHPEVRNTFRDILHGRTCNNETHFQRLRAAGLIKGATRHEAEVRCELYHEYFKKHL